MDSKYIDILMKMCNSKNEVPISAIVVKDNKIISKASNKRIKTNDVTAHAEIIAIRKAAKKLKDWRLNECDLYVTLEPCNMCKNIIQESRIKKVYYLIDKLDYKKSYNKTEYSKLEIQQDVSKKYKQILNDFFKKKR